MIQLKKFRAIKYNRLTYSVIYCIFFSIKLPQNLQPPRVRFYVRVPGEGGIGTKSHGHDSSIRIPNFSHIQVSFKQFLLSNYLKTLKDI